MNIECESETLAELEGLFRFNDAVLRHLTIRRQSAIVEQSLMMKAKEEKDRSSRSYDDRRRPSPGAAPKAPVRRQRPPRLTARKKRLLKPVAKPELTPQLKMRPPQIRKWLRPLPKPQYLLQIRKRLPKQWRQQQTNQARRLQTLKALKPDQEQEKHHATPFQTQKILSLHR